MGGKGRLRGEEREGGGKGRKGVGGGRNGWTEGGARE